MMSNRLNGLKISRNLVKVLALLWLTFFLLLVGAIVVQSASNHGLLVESKTEINPVNQVKAGDFAQAITQIRATEFVESTETKIPTLKWLKLTTDVYKNWHVLTWANNPSTLVITPKGEAADLDQKVVLALIPRESEVYGIAVSTNLSLFQKNKIPATFVVVNYGEIEAYGLSLLEQAKKKNIDLILTVGSRATDFIYRHFRGEQIPVVTNASKDPVLLSQINSYQGGSGNNIAFTSISPKPETLIAYLLQLRPSLKHIAILYAETNISAVKTQVKPMEQMAKEQGIHAMLVGVKAPNTAKTELETLIPAAVQTMRETDSDLNNSIFFLTGSVSVYEEIATINKYAENVPVIATLPDVVKEGDNSAVLSVGAQMQNVSYQASLYGIAILSEETNQKRLEVAQKLDVGIVSPPDIAINFCRAKNISLKVPFDFFEGSSFIYDYQGRKVRAFGEKLEVNKFENWQNCRASN